jgi:hypothetical protein
VDDEVVLVVLLEVVDLVVVSGTCVDRDTSTFVVPSTTVVSPFKPEASERGTVATPVTRTWLVPPITVASFDGELPRKDSIMSAIFVE